MTFELGAGPFLSYRSSVFDRFDPIGIVESDRNRSERLRDGDPLLFRIGTAIEERAKERRGGGGARFDVGRRRRRRWGRRGLRSARDEKEAIEM